MRKASIYVEGDSIISMQDYLHSMIAARQPDKLRMIATTLHERNITVAFEDAEALLQDLAERQKHDEKALMTVKSKSSKNSVLIRRPGREGRV